jgi:hypothetical protein
MMVNSEFCWYTSGCEGRWTTKLECSKILMASLGLNTNSGNTMAQTFLYIRAGPVKLNIQQNEINYQSSSPIEMSK